MLTYMLDPSRKMPLYEQLYTAIRDDIVSGALRSREKLPSKRKLAAHLRVSPVTIETAYGQLVAEGYLESAPKRGYFVQTLSSVQPPRGSAPQPSPLQAAAPVDDCRYDFRTNVVDTDCFPFSIWAKLLRGVLTERSHELLRAPDPQGAPVLREEIRRYLYQYRGIEVDIDQIIVGAGSEYLVGLLIQLLGRDKVYALENPGYPKLYRSFEASGATVLPLPLDRHGLREDRLRAAAPDIVYLTPSHHFPLGVVMPAARRLALLRWAEEDAHRYLIEDDYDSEFRYSSRPIPALKGLDRADRVIYLNTFAKSLAPSLRIGYVVLPRPLAHQFRERLGFYSSTVPSFEQYTLAEFLRTGAFERHISRSRNLYKARRDTLLAAFAHSPLASCVHLSGADAGLHLLARVENGMDEDTLIARAHEAGVHVYGLSNHYLSAFAPCPPATILLGYAGVPTEDIPDAVAQLAQAWHNKTS
ncbi:MAG: PLP-dependent aminotransferase family protein [Clostridia bacterium]|nr:PLP-dependent aminotransferase family protein [Clostridia bacterium]